MEAGDYIARENREETIKRRFRKRRNNIVVATVLTALLGCVGALSYVLTEGKEKNPHRSNPIVRKYLNAKQTLYRIKNTKDSESAKNFPYQTEEMQKHIKDAFRDSGDRLQAMEALSTIVSEDLERLEKAPQVKLYNVWPIEQAEKFENISRGSVISVFGLFLIGAGLCMYTRRQEKKQLEELSKTYSHWSSPPRPGGNTNLT